MAAILPAKGGVAVRVRVKPGGSRTVVLGQTRLSDGEEAVLVAVSAPPVDGKANKAVIELLATTWDVPKSAISVTSGATARTKKLFVADDVAGRLVAWVSALPVV